MKVSVLVSVATMQDATTPTGCCGRQKVVANGSAAAAQPGAEGGDRRDVKNQNDRRGRRQGQRRSDILFWMTWIAELMRVILRFLACCAGASS